MAAHPAGLLAASELSFAMGREPARTARTFVGSTLRAWGVADGAEHAELVAAELVSLAARHGSKRVDLQLRRCGPGVRLEVIERCRGPLVVDDDLAAAVGAATPVLDAVAEDWGEVAIGAGACLWARLRLRA